jgi:FKBP-type peptidyl-prolyl cis-trans isomerase 2
MKKVKIGNTVTVNYTGKLVDGSIFDSSLNEGREPLVAKLGEGQLIKGFENGLVDMSEGESKTITIPCKDAYGEKLENMTNEVPKANLPEGVKIGDTLQGFGPNGPVLVTVVEINEETVTIDANHPLAGKDLVFELEVLGIEE